MSDRKLNVLDLVAIDEHKRWCESASEIQVLMNMHGTKPEDLLLGQSIVDYSLNKLKEQVSHKPVQARGFCPEQFECEKVTESIFDLKDEFDRGELFTKKFNEELHVIKSEAQLGRLLDMNDDPKKNGIYRRIALTPEQIHEREVEQLNKEYGDIAKDHFGVDAVTLRDYEIFGLFASHAINKYK